jgi:hypothetical protein
MLEKLKEYKDLIGIIVFFLGGLLWIQGQFPTKNDLKAEVGVLKCLLDKYMTLTQLQIRGRELERLIQEQSSQINAIGNSQGAASAPLSPAMQQELEAKRADLAANRSEFKAKTTEMQKIADELQRNVCAKVTP